MAWFFNSHTGKLVHEDPPAPGYYVYEGLLHTGTGWHQLPIGGDVPESQAIAYAEQQYPGSPKPNSQNDLTGVGSEVTGTAGSAVQNVANSVPGLSQIGKFFNDLSQASTWIRVAEVLAGLVLIAVGVARITHALPVATKIAKTVGTKGLA